MTMAWLALLAAVAALAEGARTVHMPTSVYMVDHLGSSSKVRTKLGAKGKIYVWEEGVDDVADRDEFHGYMNFPAESFPSFLEVGEQAGAPTSEDAQNLSPSALQCYCKFKKPLVETIPASAFNNKKENEGATSFVEEQTRVEVSHEAKGVADEDSQPQGSVEAAPRHTERRAEFDEPSRRERRRRRRRRQPQRWDDDENRFETQLLDEEEQYRGGRYDDDDEYDDEERYDRRSRSSSHRHRRHRQPARAREEEEEEGAWEERPRRAARFRRDERAEPGLRAHAAHRDLRRRAREPDTHEQAEEMRSQRPAGDDERRGSRSHEEANGGFGATIEMIEEKDAARSTQQTKPRENKYSDSMFDLDAESRW